MQLKEQRPFFINIGTCIPTSLFLQRTLKSLGQLVVLGFDVTVFTPAPYQRHRL